jgi:hypothetical protein
MEHVTHFASLPINPPSKHVDSIAAGPCSLSKHTYVCVLACSTTAGGPCHHVGIITHLSEDACLQITANVLSDMFHRTRVSYTVDLNHRPGNVVCIIGNFGGIPAWFLSPGYSRRSGQDVSDLDDVSVLSGRPM